MNNHKVSINKANFRFHCLSKCFIWSMESFHWKLYSLLDIMYKLGNIFLGLRFDIHLFTRNWFYTDHCFYSSKDAKKNVSCLLTFTSFNIKDASTLWKQLTTIGNLLSRAKLLRLQKLFPITTSSYSKWYIKWLRLDYT